LAVPLCQVADPIGDQLLAEMTKRIVNRAWEGYGENLRQLTEQIRVELPETIPLEEKHQHYLPEELQKSSGARLAV
jgi:hypothetical protein